MVEKEEMARPADIDHIEPDVVGRRKTACCLHAVFRLTIGLREISVWEHFVLHKVFPDGNIIVISRSSNFPS